MNENNILESSFNSYQKFGDFDLIIAEKPKIKFICDSKQSLGERVAIGLCTKGSAELTVNGTTSHIKKGDLLFYFPQYVASAKKMSDDFDISLIVFSKHFENKHVYRKSLSLSDIIRFVGKHRLISLGKEDASFYLNLRQMLVQTMQMRDNIFRDEILHSFVSSMMQWISGLISGILESEPVALKRNDELVSRFLHLVSQNCRKNHRLEYYADLLCVSPKYLSTVARLVTTHSAGRLIIFIVIGEAKQMLLESHLSVLQIALDLGFPNQSTFGKYFKREVGMTPSQFRASV